jgi:hypothetical protein
MENTQVINTTVFNKGMVKDIAPEFLGEGQYLHAINTVNNSIKGDKLKIGNEPSNFECIKFQYTYIGNIPLINSRYLIFSTNNFDSEIGLFNERDCTYEILINDSNQSNKLNFKTTNLIEGASKENYDCTESAYWDDGLNPSRYLNINDLPYVIKYKKDPLGGCDIEERTKEIDIEKLRSFPFLSVPKLELSKGDSGGTLQNGTYRVAIAYSTDTFRLTDYLKLSDAQVLYSNFPSGSLEITIEADKTFTNYELVLISTINQQTTARLLGRYPVEQSKVYVDSISQTDQVIPLTNIALQSIYYEGADATFSAGDYLMKVGVRTRPEFNYQSQASKIISKWVSYAVPVDYYKRGGNKIGYTKGEIIPLFIRFVYNTGHRSSSFPLVGREAVNGERDVVRNSDSLSYADGEEVQRWEMYDTSTITNTFNPLNETEFPVAEGELGYYEASDIYPDNKEVWGKLACKPIRHGVIPGNCTVPNYDASLNKLLIVGLKFENITYPLDENGKPIPGIVGYEILRADKEGNKSIIAKGLVFNTGEYESPISYNNNNKVLYSNYPFNDLNVDPYLSKEFPKGGCDSKGYSTVGTYKRDVFTFHSPETHFANPALSSYLKVEAEYNGNANGYFEPVYNHPKHKLVRDFALLLAAGVGIGEGLLAIRGKTTTTYEGVKGTNKGEVVTGGAIAQIAGSGVAAAHNSILDAAKEALKNLPVTNIVTGVTEKIAEVSGIVLGATPGAEGGRYTYTKEDTAFKNIPIYVKVGTNVVLFSYFFAQGTSTVLNVIKTLAPYRQHAFQCNMSGLYTSQQCVDENNIVRKIQDYSYVYSGVQNFQNYSINNNLRESSVILKLDKALRDPKLKDLSRQTIGTLKQWNDPTRPFQRPISAYYVSIKRKLKNVYGQLESIRIVPTTSEIFPISQSSPSQTGIIFGGDTIIEEFTLKRKNNLFTQTQADGVLANPNGYEFDYRYYPNILYPRYWMDTQEYDLTQLFNLSNVRLPNDSFHLDRDPAQCRRRVGFTVNNSYMYTSINGIVRFFVESSYNLPFRKQHVNELEKAHFERDTYTDLSRLFRSDIIRQDNYFEIDKSLSPIKQLNFNYSQLLPRDFSVKNNKCFTYESNKLIYSLPASLEQKQDNWRSFLVNNFWLFSKSEGNLTAIRSINRTGVLYFFSSGSLKIHPGVDELVTENGLKVLVGDGGLFARQPQSVVNTDYDFTECQSAQSIVSTQYGVFFISQRQGKIFNYAGQVRDISSPIKFWLAEHLPSKLLKQFPDFELKDNPVSGIGCLSVFDNVNEVVFFSKIDYAVKPEFLSRIKYKEGNEFLLDSRTTIVLGDTRYFNNASWTLSYDPVENYYISFHDWHPNAFIQKKNHFFTVKGSKVWSHNEDKGEYCNFYGIDYPWEIEYPFTNMQQSTTVESFEYKLQSYKLFNEGKDRYHILNENFDRAVVWNSEQCSGLLKLNMREYNRPAAILEYPRYNTDSVDIEVVKTENNYRFNQVRDLVKNRGQFSLNWKTIWNTEENGYKKSLNFSNIDYAKVPSERKKIRHNTNIVLLRKNISRNVKFLLTLINNKSQKSFR